MAESTAKLNVLVALRSAIADGDRPLEWLKKFTLGLTAAGSALSVFTAKQSIEFGSAITDMANEAQMGAQALQTLAAVGSESGAKMEIIAKASEKLRKALQQAREDGADPLNANLRTLNLTAAGLQAIAPERQWEEIARAMANASDKQSALNAASALFGEKNLPKMQELLQRLGTEGFDKLSEATKSLRVSDAELKTLDDAGDKLSRIATQLKVIGAKWTVAGLNNPAVGITANAMELGGGDVSLERKLEIARSNVEGWKAADNDHMVKRWQQEVADLERRLENVDARTEQARARRDDAAFAQANAQAAAQAATMAAATQKEVELTDALAVSKREAASRAATLNAEAARSLQLQKESEAVFASTLTPLERYNDESERLGLLLRENAITQETYNRALDAAKVKLAAATTLQDSAATLNARLAGINERRTVMEGDYTRTAAEKWGERRKLLAEEIAARQQALDLLVAQRAAVSSPEAQRGYDQQIATGTEQIGGLKGQLSAGGADPNSLDQQMRSQFTSLQDQMGTVQQSIAAGFGETIGTAIQTCSAGLQTLLGDTTYWQEKLGAIGGPIMASITKGVSEMFVKWVAGRALAGAASILWSTKEGAADVAAKGPGALLTSISSFGAAPIIGLAAIVAAMAAFGGFEGGGWTGGTEGQPAGVVHGEEFVFSAPAVRAIGADNLTAQHQAALRSESTTPAPVAKGAGGASGGKYLKVVMLRHDDKAGIAEQLADPAAERVLFQFMRTHRGEFGVEM